MTKGISNSGHILALVCVLLALPHTAASQVLPNIQDPLRRPLGELERTRERLETRARRQAQAEAEAAEEAAEETAGETVDFIEDTADERLEAPGATVQSAAQAVDDATGVAAQAGGNAATTLTRVLRDFVLAASPDGWPVEARTVVALLDDDQRQDLQASGLDVVSERSLPGIGRTLVTFREPTTAPLETTLDTIRSAYPGAPADYNHIYRLQSDQESGEREKAAAEPTSAGDDLLTVGLIDSAVDAAHFSLAGATLESASFVGHEGTEPVNHGTAVASLLHRAADGQAKILSASVFFQTPNYAPGATTESLVAALDWLANENVQAINMSLAGPANQLLEATLAALRETGPPVVAAVGNNGPRGEPMYPAAYDGVIGVTAVDRDKKIYLYANRSDSVDFAALGVNVKVADAGAGWRIESGTSMASPLVAVLVAGMRQQGAMAAEEVVDHLSALAEDLGAAGLDPVFGHGLVTRQPALVSQHQKR